MSDEDLHAEVERLRAQVGRLTSAVAQLAQHLLGDQINGVLAMFANAQPPFWQATPQHELVTPQLPAIPLRPVEDVLPRGGRNPHIGCQQYDSGTWVHGRPHDCPTWARHP